MYVCICVYVYIYNIYIYIYIYIYINMYKCDRACDNRAYLHTTFGLIFEFLFTITFKIL